MVVVDYLTKWMEAYALKDHQAQTVVDTLVQEWVCRLGPPKTIHTDQGPEYVSVLFKEFAAALEIKKTRTSPYHPAGDGMVERANRTI